MNLVLAVEIFFVLSIGVAHSCRLSPPPPCPEPPPPCPEPSPSPPPPCPEPSPSPPPCPEPSPSPPCPEPSPSPPPCPEPSPSPPCPEPSPSPPPPCPEPSPSPPPPCPEPSPSPPPPCPYLPPPNFGDSYASNSYQTRSSSSSSKFSEKSSSYRSSSSSSTLSSLGIDTDLYQDAFDLASISQTEAKLYMKYLDQLSGSQLSAFDELIEYYKSRNFALSNTVTNFVAFKNEMTNIYNLLSTHSIYTADCDWASRIEVYQQIQANLDKAISYTAQDSCLYNLLEFANTDVTCIPLVVGCCYHLVDMQHRYFTTSYSSSSSHQESYQASSQKASSSSSFNTINVV